MFGFDNQEEIWKAFSKIKFDCELCDLYHTKKFDGFTCACTCHEQQTKQQETLEWDTDEEITKPM